MQITCFRNAVWLFAIFLSLDSHAESMRVAFEPGMDLEVVAAFPGNGGEVLVLQRSFLEPRKARMDPARGASDTLQVLSTRSGRKSDLLSYKADAPLWTGPPRPTQDGVSFAVRAGSGTAAVYATAGGDSVARRIPMPWETSNSATKPRDYERVFLAADVVIGVYPEVGVYRAELWTVGAAAPVALDLAIENGDGRIIAIEDIAEVDGRVVLLVTIASAHGAGQGEFWLLSFDRTFKRAAARAMRLETGTVASGKASFVRKGSAVVAVRVTQRSSKYAKPSLKIFPLNTGVALWSYEFPRLVGADDVAIAGVCKASFLMLRGAHDDRGRTTVAEWVLIGPSGQESLIERQVMPEGTLLTRMVVATESSKLWSYLNFSRFEGERRADGWYSWRGYQVNADAQTRYCRFE